MSEEDTTSQRSVQDRLQELAAKMPWTNPSAPALYIGGGWIDIVERCHQDLTTIDPGHTVTQVKQKLGGLRYYATPSESITSRALHGFGSRIRLAEIEASLACERCGRRGRLRELEWVGVWCDEHVPARQAPEDDDGAEDPNGNAI